MAKILTPFGTAQIDTAQKKLNAASGLFDGNSDYLTTPIHNDFHFEGENFTIEFFARFASTSGTQVFCGDYTLGQSWIVYFTGNELHFAWNDGAGSTDIGKAWTPSTNTWYHIAAVRTTTVVKLYVDGTQVGTDISIGTDSINALQTALHIAQEGNGSYFNGWLDELRISKGIARYTGNFTPTTVEFTSDANTKLLLHFEGADASTTFTDSSNTAYMQSLSEVIVLVDTLSKQSGKIYEEIITVVDTVATIRGKVVTLTNEVIALVDTVSVKITGRALTEVFTVVDTIAIKITAKVFLEVVTIVDTISNQAGKTLSEVITIIDIISNQAGKVFSEVITVVDTVVRQTGKALSEVITIVDTFTNTVTRAVGYILGLNKDTNTQIGTRSKLQKGLNKDTNTQTGTRKS